MARYIGIDAVVAEIKRLLSAFENSDAPVDRLRASLLIGLLSFVNTIEVKEVDLEKELNYFIEQQKAWVKDDMVVEYNNGDSFNHIYDLRDIANHFFELGIKVAQKGE